MTKIKDFFRKVRYGTCKFCGDIEEPVIIYGKHYYNTAQCRCPEGRATVYKWLEAMDANWIPPPKTEAELLIEAVNRVADALNYGPDHAIIDR